MNFSRPVREFFLGFLCVHEFVSFNFPLHDYFLYFVCPSNRPSLTRKLRRVPLPGQIVVPGTLQLGPKTNQTIFGMRTVCIHLVLNTNTNGMT